LGSKLRRGARCFAPYLVRTGTTHGSRELTTRESQPGNEKGGWCKPPLSLELTPQNRKPSRGWDPATPGSQSFSTALRKREQTMCHGVIRNSQPSTRMKLRELALFESPTPAKPSMTPTKSHRQIRAYIHSLGETPLLHRCDTQDPPKDTRFAELPSLRSATDQLLRYTPDDDETSRRPHTNLAMRSAKAT